MTYESMRPQEARELLSFHSGRNPDVHDERWVRGFLGSLRPYGGQLNHEAFHSVVASIRTLSDELKQPLVDRNLLADVMVIVHFGRAWAVEEGGMLRSNALISNEDIETMSYWLNCISYAVALLLDESDEDTAFEHYDRSFAQGRHGA